MRGHGRQKYLRTSTSCTRTADLLPIRTAAARIRMHGGAMAAEMPQILASAGPAEYPAGKHTTEQKETARSAENGGL